jgi:Uma2 family endonuclease
MTAVASSRLMTVDEYLAAELASAVRHEYLGGYLYAMAGGKNVHNLIATNFLVILGGQLRGQPCAAYNSDTKLRIRMASHTRFYYPDAMIVCAPNPPEEPYQDQPVVLVEVVSADTRRVDESEKREAYLSIPSLRTYLLVEQDEARVAVYRRGDQGFALEAYAGLDSAVPLDEIAASLRLVELYERVEFPPATSSENRP